MGFISSLRCTNCLPFPLTGKNLVLDYFSQDFIEKTLEIVFSLRSVRLVEQSRIGFFKPINLGVGFSFRADSLVVMP